MEVVASCTGISSISLPMGLGVVLIFQFISHEGKVGDRLLPCPLPGDIKPAWDVPQAGLPELDFPIKG